MDGAQGCEVQLFALKGDARRQVALDVLGLLEEVVRKFLERLMTLSIVPSSDYEVDAEVPWLGSDKLVDEPATYRISKAATQPGQSRVLSMV